MLRLCRTAAQAVDGRQQAGRSKPVNSLPDPRCSPSIFPITYSCGRVLTNGVIPRGRICALFCSRRHGLTDVHPESSEGPRLKRLSLLSSVPTGPQNCSTNELRRVTHRSSPARPQQFLRQPLLTAASFSSDRRQMAFSVARADDPAITVSPSCGGFRVKGAKESMVFKRTEFCYTTGVRAEKADLHGGGSSTGGEGCGNLHRNEEIACEKIRVQMTERRRETQLFCGDPTVRCAPFQAGR